MENRMLRAEMALYGDTIESLADYLGIHRVTCSKKICGASDFNQTEMSLIKKRYSLSDEKFAQIFGEKENVQSEDQRSSTAIK